MSITKASHSAPYSLEGSKKNNNNNNINIKLRTRHQTDFPWETTWTRLNGRTAVDEDYVDEDNESDDTLYTIHSLKVVKVIVEKINV